MNLTNYSHAIQYFDKVLTIDPHDVDTLNSKGNALSKLGNYTGAIEYYNKVLAVEPHNVWALYDKGNTLDKLGNYTGAIEYYNKALAIQPNLDALTVIAPALTNKGVALYDLGPYHDAIASYDKVLALNPNDVDAKNNKANALGKLDCMEGNNAACHTGGTNMQKPAQPSQPDLLVSFAKAIFQ